MSAYDRQALMALIKDSALKFGSFRLASGKTAGYYLDCRQVTLDALGAKLVAEGMLELLEGHMPDAVGGMAIGADPITGAVVALAGIKGIPLKGVMIRKEPKGHGMGRYLEGPVEPGQRVVLVEDVVTTGGSLLLAIDRCDEFGLKVERALAIIDRLEGGGEALAARGCPLTSLLTIRDFGIDTSADTS